MPERVIMVATEETTGALLSKPLYDAGYSTMVVSSPQEARELLHTQEVEAIILAIPLRDSNALCFCQELRETLGPSVVLMAVCPPGPASHYVVALEVGVDDVVVMPVVADEVLARLAAHLRRCRLSSG